MKLPCEMMEDLLPLYAEDMATNATRAAVEEHVAECEPCRNKLDAMRGEKREGAPAVSLEPVRKELNRRRWSMVLAAVCAVATVLLLVFSIITKPIYIKYAEGVVDMEGPENGKIIMTFHGASRMDLGTWSLMDDEGKIHTGSYMVPYYTLLDRWMGSVKDYSIRSPEDDIVWYGNMVADGELVPLVNAPETWWSGGARVMRRLYLNYLMIFAAGAALGLFALLCLLRRKPVGRVLKYLCALPVCYILANGLIVGYGAASYHASRDFIFIAMISVTLWGFIVAGVQLVQQIRRDRV